MTVEECWAKWEPYWHLRHNGPNTLPVSEQYVLGRYGDQGQYTVDNCRVITHRENTLERNHKLVGRKGLVNNPTGRTGPTRRIHTPEGVFEHCAAAASHYGIHRTSMWHRVKSELWPDFRVEP